MNSSSTHSLLLLRDPENSSELEDSEEVKRLEFGWEYWTATSKEAKRNYLGIAIFSNLLIQFPINIAWTITKETFGIELPDARSAKFAQDKFYIDHQSEWTLPWNFQETMLHQEFIKEFEEFLLRKDIVIVGGNDNDDNTHPLTSKAKDLGMKLPVEEHTGGRRKLIARKDRKYNYWVLFNRGSGAKIRMTFDETA